MNLLFLHVVQLVQQVLGILVVPEIEISMIIQCNNGFAGNFNMNATAILYCIVRSSERYKTANKLSNFWTCCSMYYECAVKNEENMIIFCSTVKYYSCSFPMKEICYVHFYRLLLDTIQWHFSFMIISQETITLTSTI